MASTIQSKLESSTFGGPIERDNGRERDSRSRSSTPQLQRPTIVVTSYDRHTPPYPIPDLQYDCRETENPPRRMRVLHTGLSECLQQELMSRNEFSDLLTRAECEIKGLMQRKLEEDDGVPVVTVGCLCGSGHHRSVAFAEQLRKCEWPEEWDVKVVHRDLTDEVREGKRRNRVRFGEMKEGKARSRSRSSQSSAD